MLNFTCPTHGQFEVLTDKRDGPPEFQPCPDVDKFEALECSIMSPVVTAYAVRGRMKLGEVTQGKNDQPLPPHIMSTEALADGMPLAEWKEKNRKRDHSAAMDEIKRRT